MEPRTNIRHQIEVILQYGRLLGKAFAELPGREDEVKAAIASLDRVERVQLERAVVELARLMPFLTVSVAWLVRYLNLIAEARPSAADAVGADRRTS